MIPLWRTYILKSRPHNPGTICSLYFAPQHSTLSLSVFTHSHTQSLKRPSTMATPKESDLYPIAVLIDELKHEDKKVRLNAMKSIQTIGTFPSTKLYESLKGSGRQEADFVTQPIPLSWRPFLIVIYFFQHCQSISFFSLFFLLLFFRLKKKKNSPNLFIIMFSHGTWPRTHALRVNSFPQRFC